MVSRRDELLRAISEASTIHDRFSPADGSSFDVLGAIIELGVPVLFRPLDGLWGATVAIGKDRGILVNTKIGRPVQRFTLAHELGHVMLGHRSKFDHAGFAEDGIMAQQQLTEERAANAFASELLAPPTFLARVARHHRWQRAHLQNAPTIYQLSLRLGISFAATCLALQNEGVLSRAKAAQLLAKGVHTLKRTLVAPGLIRDSWADIWELKPSDQLHNIEAGPFDLFVVRLKDLASSGFLWEPAMSGTNSRVVLDESAVSEKLGETTSRKVVFEFVEAERHRLRLEQRRPWTSGFIDAFDVGVDTRGKETGGLPRRLRERAVATLA
jgi:Zn-dependent peptidase ImmA (M78 family)